MLLVKDNMDRLIQKSPYKEGKFSFIVEKPDVGSSFYDYGATKTATFAHYEKGFESEFLETIRPQK